MILMPLKILNDKLQAKQKETSQMLIMCHIYLHYKYLWVQYIIIVLSNY